MTDSMLIFAGGAVKALGDGKVGGFGVFFSNEREPDLDGDFFTARTDLGLEDRITLPLYFGHATDPSLGKRKLAKGSFKQTDQGLWVETQLDVRDRWLQKIYELVVQGKLSFSSGAVAHLTEREKKGTANWIKTWPVGEVSFTPCPAAPFGTQVEALKSYSLPSLKETIRRSKLSAVEVVREESMRVRTLAESALGLGPTPDRWADHQSSRAARGAETYAAKRDWIAMRDQAKSKLAEADKILKAVQALEQKNRARPIPERSYWPYSR